MRRVLALVTGKNKISTDGIPIDDDDTQIKNYNKNDNGNLNHDDDAPVQVGCPP